MDDYDNLQMDLDRINAGSKGKKSDNWMSYEKEAENNAEGNDNGEEAGEEEGEGEEAASEHETSELVSDSLQIVLEESGGRPSRRRSNMWAHFVTLSKETARCRHCHKNLNYRSSATNLKRHLRVMHPEEADALDKTDRAGKAAAEEDEEEEEEEEEEEVMPTPKKRGRPSTSALLSSRKQQQQKKKPAPKGKKKKKAPPPPKKKKAPPPRKKKRKKVSSSEESSEEEEESEEDSEEEEDSDEEDDSDEESSEEEYTSPEKESPRKNFTRIGEHNKVTHPKKKKPPKEVKITPPAPRERKPKKVHQKRKRSRLWDFFVKLDETYAECNACKCRLVWKSGLSNLAKHYSMKHSGKNQMTEIELAVNASLNPTDGQAAGTNNGGAPLKKRKKRQSENHWRCAIWKLFERKDDVFSQCRSCNKKISHRSTNANLLKHTRIKHPEIYFKFEERLKDFSHNVNILVDHFFPDTLIQPGGHHPPAPLAPEDPMQQQQDYPMGGGEGGGMYEPYSFPVIFVEEGGQQHDPANAQTSVITSANNQMAPSFGQHNMQGGHDPVNSNSGTLSTPPPMGVEGGAMVPSGGNAPMPYHGASGPPTTTGPFNMSGNYQQVLTTSFNVSGGGGPPDRLIGMVEESNQLLRGMQTAIERQSDVLVRLAESIAGPPAPPSSS